MTKNIPSFLPALSITKQYYPEKNQNILNKIIKLARFLLALPFLLIADLLYAAFYTKPSLSVQIIENPPSPSSSLPEPDPTPLVIEPALSEPSPSLEPILIEDLPTPDPLSELPIDLAPDTPEPAILPLPQSKDPVVLPPEKPSLFTRVAPLALGLLGFGTLAYLLRSYGQTSPPPSEDTIPPKEKAPSHSYPSFFDTASYSLGQCPIRYCDANFNISTCKPFQKASPFAHSALEIGPAPISRIYPSLSFGEQTSSPTLLFPETEIAPPLNNLETKVYHFDPKTFRNLSSDQCSPRDEIGFFQNLSPLEPQQPPLAPPNTPLPVNPPPSSTPDWLWGLGAAAIATAGFTLWNLVRGEDQAGLEGVPDEGALPSQGNQQPIDPPSFSPSGPGHDYPLSPVPFSPDPSHSNEEEENISPAQSTEIVRTIDALANLTPGPKGRIAIPLDHDRIKKLFLDANDLKEILWSVKLGNLEILERSFRCEIERINEFGERERLPDCTVTPLDLLQNLPQSRSLSSGSGSSSDAPDPTIAKWTEYLSQVSAPFCSFDLSDDRDFSTMYVRPEILIEALQSNSSGFKCFLEPRNSDDLSSEAQKLPWTYSEDLRKEGAVVEYNLNKFLSDFTPTPRNQFAFSHGESSNAGKSFVSDFISNDATPKRSNPKSILRDGAKTTTQKRDKEEGNRHLFGDEIVTETHGIEKSNLGKKPTTSRKKRNHFNPFSVSSGNQPATLKERLQQLIRKNPILVTDVRDQIINGYGVTQTNQNPESCESNPKIFIWKEGFRKLPDEYDQSIDVKSLPWDVEKLLSELGASLPFISLRGKKFESVERLLCFFGTSSGDLESAGDDLIATLCCLTREAAQNCRRELHLCVNKDRPYFRIEEDSAPEIKIDTDETGSTRIEISQNFFIRGTPQSVNQKQIEPRIEITAHLSLKRHHSNTLRIEHQPLQRKDPETVFIPGGSARFTPNHPKPEEELPSLLIKPLGYDPYKDMSWGEWTYNMLPSYEECQNWLVHALTHRPGPVHNHKYHIALDVLIESLKIWIASNVTHNNGLDDYQKNLRAAYEGKDLDTPYDTLFNGDYRNSPFVAKVIEALDGLMASDSIRNRNQKYLSALRDALQMAEYRENHGSFKHLHDLLRALCWARFTQNRMQKYEEEFLRLAIEGTFPQLYCSTIAHAIETGNEKLKNCNRELKKAPQDSVWQKFRNSTGILADPLGQSNIPEVRSIYAVERGKEKPYAVLCLRHGTPTYQPATYWSALTTPETVVPEYRCFLDEARERKMDVLYVNHQKMFEPNPGWINALSNIETREENHRAHAIQALENDHPHFHFLSLPYDGKIWSNEMLGIGSTFAWKEFIAGALVDGEHGFQLPKGCRLTKETLLKLADDIHHLYFRNKTQENFALVDLDLQERKLFLMIFYSYVKELIMAEYNIRIIASPCKDDKDRGNTSKGVDEALRNLRCGLENDEGALHRLYVRTLAPFIIKYEEIIDERLHPLLNLLNHIASLSDSEKKEIQNYCPVSGYRLLNLKDEETFYPIYTDIQSATPLKETQFGSFKEFIKTACQKAGTAVIPEAQANLLYKSSSAESNDAFRNPTNKSWILENLKASLERLCILNGKTCRSLENIEEALGIEANTLYHNNHSTESNYHFGRLASLTKKAVAICDQGLTHFLEKNSPFPRDSIEVKRISEPLFQSRLETPPHWTNVIAQDYLLQYNGERIRVCVRAETNSYKETTVTIYPIRNDQPSVEEQ